MKRLLASTAVALCAVGAAMAQTAESTDLFVGAETAGDIYGTDLIGQRLYVDETEIDDTKAANDAMRAEWDDVGEINDLLISPDGTVKAALLDVGGFLGLGERTIAVSMSQLHFLPDPDDPNDVFVAVTGTKEGLENAPEFTGGERYAAGRDTTATAPAAVTTDADRSMALVPPIVEREGYTPLEREALTAERLTGAAVYGPDDETVGEISSLVLGADGTIQEVVIDVGGFLGMGEHPVAVSFDELLIIDNADSSDLRVYIEASKEKLENRPIYGG